MSTLKKPKSFSVSDEKIVVYFQGVTCEIANLLKSGITNQTIVLVDYNGRWNEINVLDLGGDDSNLKAFKNFVETMNLSLVDLGIISATVKTDYSMKHDDFMELSEQFADYDYIQISQLNDYELKSVQRTGMHHLTETLKYISSKKLTVEKYIEESETSKQQIIKNMKAGQIIPGEYAPEIQELEAGPDGQAAIPVEKIEVVSAEILSNEKPNTPVHLAKKSISLEVFETLTPDRISELQGLNERQLEIVKANPVVKITDKKTYEAAKKTAATLLKASTAIDGKDGIESTATKYLNTFKSMLKTALQPIAKLTRDPYDEQKQIISAWENAELLREQAEQRAKLAKIKLRTDELFAVPFTFNGSIYSIGTVYVTPSQVETATDEDFKVIVENGKAIKLALDAEALKNSEKDKEIADLKAQLAALTGLSNMSNTEPEPVEVKAPTVEKPVNTFNARPANNTVKNPVPESYYLGQTEHASDVYAQAAPQPQTPTYIIPSPENELLNRLDMKNVEHLENKNYIKCRGYYIQGLVDVANEIEFILNDAAPNPIKKSERLANLAAVLKKS